MSTIVGREKLDHPSLGAAGGSALHAAIETIYTSIGDDNPGRFKAYAAVANSAVTVLDHNYGVAFEELNIYIYTGTFPALTRVASPVAAGWSIAATSGFLKTKIDITAPSSGGPHTFVAFVVHGSLNLDSLTDVDLTVAPEDGQALVYETASTSWKPGASGDASFKIQSVSTPNAVVKGGYLLVDNGKELATYDGAGTASTDFGKDLTVNLTTIFGSAPANATAYYLYIDLNSLGAAVTQSDTGRKVFAVVEANFVLSTTTPDVIDLSRYVPRAVIKSATSGTVWSGAGAGFATLAFLAGQTVDGSLKTFVRPQITQAAHGFTSSNHGAPLYLTAGGVYTLAKADAANTADVVGLIYSIIDVNTFVMALFGDVTVNTAVSGGALVVGSTYYVSAATAGLITATEPSTIGHVSKPVGIAKSTTVLEFLNMRGVIVGGSNALTAIAFANNATTTIQDVSAYQGGELSGYVSIVATASQKFFIKAQFSKNAAGTDYTLSYQTSGDTPPASFVMTVTTAGLIQITIGSLAGFASSGITYALNAPAVGASFPLSIQASKVAGAVDGAAVAAGYIGQVISATATGVSMGGSNTSTQVATVSLPAGVWRLLGAATYRKNAATISDQELQVGLTTGSGVAGTINGKNRSVGSQIGTAIDAFLMPPLSYVVNISATTSYYLNAQAKYSGGTVLYDGYLEAVRIA